MQLTLKIWSRTKVCSASKIGSSNNERVLYMVSLKFHKIKLASFLSFQFVSFWRSAYILPLLFCPSLNKGLKQHAWLNCAWCILLFMPSKHFCACTPTFLWAEKEFSQKRKKFSITAFNSNMYIFVWGILTKRLITQMIRQT